MAYNDHFQGRKGKKATIRTGEDGCNKITPEFLVELCEEHGQYMTPNLNSELYLHFKGFQYIENLDAYTGLKTLWLESNGIKKISGLESLK
jgi:dynein assembly factor 1